MSSSRLICLTIITILILGCATTSENSYTAACNPRSFCFNQRNIRNVETIDRDTLLVRVGSSNCPYLIHLDGIFCDISFGSAIGFLDSNGLICRADSTEIISDPYMSSRRDSCRIRDVKSVTDDELLEFRVNNGQIPPIPPAGPGILSTQKSD